MGYIDNKRRRSGAPRMALGDVFDTVRAAAASVDPYFPEALCRIDQLRALKKDRTPLEALFGKKPTVPVPVCTSMPPDLPGIGIEKAIRPLRMAAYMYQHPTVVWLGLTLLLGIPFVAGYVVGKGSRR